MTPAQMRAAMRKWNVPFKEYGGWTTRRRPGSFAPVGLIIHHTGSDTGQNSANYDRFLFVTGRPESGIPGPLCQAACEMDGDVILGAIGRANHAGKGAANTRSLVGGDDAPLNGEIEPGPDVLDGNALYYGIEVKYDGGQPMTSKQYQSTLRWAAAICDHYGWTAGSVIGHREHTRRKSDPGKCPMDKFRRDLAALLKTPVKPPAAKPPANTPTEEQIMATADELMAAMKAHDTEEDLRYQRYEKLFGILGDKLDRVIATLSSGGEINSQLDRIEADTDDGTGA
jgi:hypothetical protein